MSRRLVVFLAAVAVGCGTASVVQTALHGDLASLKREIRQDQQHGALDRGRVSDLASAVAGRELRSATGQAAIHRVRQLRACSGSLTAVLEDRAARPDDVGGEAALVLLEHHDLDAADALARYAESSSGAWRAVAARAATGGRDGELRRHFMADPDQRVRRAALSAAADARDPYDLDALLDTARLDPDPLARSMATRAVGAIGGERAVLALEDHWDRADDLTRLAIVDAWAMPAALKSGGARELVSLVERETSLAALAAADALIRLGVEGDGQGRAALARAITDGTEDERRTAMQTAPIDDPDVRTALDKALAGQGSGDPRHGGGAPARRGGQAGRGHADPGRAGPGQGRAGPRRARRAGVGGKCRGPPGADRSARVAQARGTAPRRAGFDPPAGLVARRDRPGRRRSGRANRNRVFNPERRALTPKPPDPGRRAVRD